MTHNARENYASMVGNGAQLQLRPNVVFLRNYSQKTTVVFWLGTALRRAAICSGTRYRINVHPSMAYRGVKSAIGPSPHPIASTYERYPRGLLLSFSWSDEELDNAIGKFLVV